MDIFNVIKLLGGLAMFIYGMGVMSQGLEKVAGGKLQKIIETITGKLLKGVLVGVVVTAIIQSSSATTVMVVGFVNAGIMTLRQAVGVIMGANIGTTVTALMISLNVIESKNLILSFLKPSNLAPLAIIIGILLMMLSKKQKGKEIGEIFIGFGVLFAGVNAMSGSVSVLKDSPFFETIFATLTNPVLGILAGALITAVIQSSSASVGILQAVAQSGLVPFSAAMPIILGQNIGTCITALLSSIGTSKNAKRAAFVHLYFNVIGTMIFIAAVYIFQYTIGFAFWNDAVNSFSIAQIHICFNILNTLIMLPFANLLVKLANLTVKEGDETGEQKILDERFLSTPSIALEQSRKSLINMSIKAIENYRLGRKAVMEKDTSVIDLMEENEHFIDKVEYSTNQYLVKVNKNDLSHSELQLSNMLLHSISDIERVGDHCENLSEIALQIEREQTLFSEAAINEINLMFDAVEEILELTIDAFEKNSVEIALKVEPLEEVIDMLKESLNSAHIKRLMAGVCLVDTGIHFVEIATNLERIADHCSNIAFSVIQYNLPNQELNPHEYLKELHKSGGQLFDRYFEMYEKKYIKSV